MSLLQLENLQIEYEVEGGSLVAAQDINLVLDEATNIGLVGESGSGKSTVAKAILGLLDSNGHVTNGRIMFKGEDLTAMSKEEMNRRIRWQEISYIPQNAMAALDPVYRVGAQIVEAIQAHTSQSKTEAKERALSLLNRVDLDEDRFRDYPHQLSGGQRQRVTIALALALDPALIIADEPTTGLDVIVQDAILDLLAEIQEDVGCSILMVTHDMSVVAEMADQTAVMYGGWLMESGPTVDVFERSANPYTIGLKNAFPSLDVDPDPSDLINIPGSPPSLDPPPDGCRFGERCPFATEKCLAVVPPTVELNSNQRSKCHYPDQSDDFRERGQQTKLWRETP